MRSEHQEQLAAVLVGVSDRPFRVTSEGVHTVDTSHFDNKVRGMVKYGPLIPCERRMPRMEISEFQEVTSRTRFGI